MTQVGEMDQKDGVTYQRDGVIIMARACGSSRLIKKSTKAWSAMVEVEEEALGIFVSNSYSNNTSQIGMHMALAFEING